MKIRYFGGVFSRSIAFLTIDPFVDHQREDRSDRLKKCLEYIKRYFIWQTRRIGRNDTSRDADIKIPIVANR